MKPTLLWKILQGFFRILTTVCFDLKVYGAEHVPRRGGVLLLSNHQSYLDPVLLAVQLRRPISYFAKSGLFENRYFGWAIRLVGAFPVRQGKGDTSAVREAIRRLREGHVLNIYPEGSRTEDGEIAPIERGAALVIRRLEGSIAVVPVVIDGSFQAWPKWRKLPRLRPITVMYGQPLEVRGKGEAEITQLIDRTLRAMLEELRHRPPGHGKM